MLTAKVSTCLPASQFLHMTCGDDTPTKVYAAKSQVSIRALMQILPAKLMGFSQGFWPDLEDYYTAPPPMITIERLSGSQEVVTQMLKILLTAA
jgi:hypothetical protein